MSMTEGSGGIARCRESTHPACAERCGGPRRASGTLGGVRSAPNDLPNLHRARAIQRPYRRSRSIGPRLRDRVTRDRLVSRFHAEEVLHSGVRFSVAEVVARGEGLGNRGRRLLGGCGDYVFERASTPISLMRPSGIASS